MAKKQIKLGYKINTGEAVQISPSHLIVTGLTQLSGKTTTLEALIKRSGLKAVVFKTKVGEKSFTEGTEIPPFFRDRSDYEFVRSLIEAYSKEKLFLEKGTLMRLCKGSASLLEIKKKVDEALLGKMRSIEFEIHTRLQHYLENLIPQIQYANLSKVLTIYDGINIMNLERFSEEAQALIIQSVADEVLKTMKDIILVIPEAWKFLPQKYNNPCKRVVESFIRQGATNNNFIWIDSQDMAGVDKIPLKQVSTWILGYQSERNEVKHTLDQISLPKKSKPKEEDVMNLRKGHFYLSSYEGVVKVYVQPAWLSDEEAIKIAKGKMKVEEVEVPNSLIPYSQAPIPKKESMEIRFDDSKIRKELIELRQDFFNKIQELQVFEQKLASELYNLKSQSHGISEDEVISKVLQKLPSFNNLSVNSVTLNKEEIIKEVLLRVPKSVGNVVYEVAPLEKIKKDFLEEAKQKILSIISQLDEQQKKILKWIEQKGSNSSKNQIFENCFGKSATSGSTYQALVKKVTDMKQLEIIRVDTAQRIFPHLKDRLEEILNQYGATPQEIGQVYNHIIMDLLK